MKITANTHNLEQRIQKVLETFKVNNPHLASVMASCLWDDCMFTMSSRLHRSIGLCKYFRHARKIVIEFSSDAFEKITDAEKDLIVAHEMAHAVCFISQVGKSHDQGWKDICAQMGGDSKRLFEGEVAVKRNLIKRVVLMIPSQNNKIIVTTPIRQKKWYGAYGESIAYVGTIVVDGNTNTYRWGHAISEKCKVLEVLSEKWKLIA